MKKRVFAIVITLLMVLNMAPMSVYAGDVEDMDMILDVLPEFDELEAADPAPSDTAEKREAVLDEESPDISPEGIAIQGVTDAIQENGFVYFASNSGIMVFAGSKIEEGDDPIAVAEDMLILYADGVEGKLLHVMFADENGNVISGYARVGADIVLLSADDGLLKDKPGVQYVNEDGTSVILYMTAVVVPESEEANDEAILPEEQDSEDEENADADSPAPSDIVDIVPEVVPEEDETNDPAEESLPEADEMEANENDEPEETVEDVIPTVDIVPEDEADDNNAADALLDPEKAEDVTPVVPVEDTKDEEITVPVEKIEVTENDNTTERSKEDDAEKVIPPSSEESEDEDPAEEMVPVEKEAPLVTEEAPIVPTVKEEVPVEDEEPAEDVSPIDGSEDVEDKTYIGEDTVSENNETSSDVLDESNESELPEEEPLEKEIAPESPQDAEAVIEFVPELELGEIKAGDFIELRAGSILYDVYGHRMHGVLLENGIVQVEEVTEIDGEKCYLVWFWSDFYGNHRVTAYGIVYEEDAFQTFESDLTEIVKEVMR